MVFSAQTGFMMTHIQDIFQVPTIPYKAHKALEGDGERYSTAVARLRNGRLLEVLVLRLYRDIEIMQRGFMKVCEVVRARFAILECRRGMVFRFFETCRHGHKMRNIWEVWVGFSVQVRRFLLGDISFNLNQGCCNCRFGIPIHAHVRISDNMLPQPFTACKTFECHQLL